MIKGVSWRLIATVDTVVLAFIFTGNPLQAFSIGGLELITKTFLFYFHERLWLKLSHGRRVENGSAKETHTRSLAKAGSWRFFGTLDTFLLAFLVTGHLHASVYIGLTELVTKIVLYYLHERLWLRITLGTTPLAQ